MNVGDMSVTFKLKKKNAQFQDGSPVTAADVKWSLDRAVTVRWLPHLPDACRVAREARAICRSRRSDRPGRFPAQGPADDTGPGCGGALRPELRSREEHATEKDPWGLDYTKLNTAGSGAYRVVNWTAGTEVVLERNDKWVGGPLPKIKRIIWRMVPSAGNRRALLERGDADISYELPNKDFVELKSAGKLNIISTPFSNGIQPSE